jgi:hypothetical protein
VLDVLDIHEQPTTLGLRRLIPRLPCRRGARAKLAKHRDDLCTERCVGVIDFDFGLDQQRSCTLSNGFRAPGLPKCFG